MKKIIGKILKSGIAKGIIKSIPFGVGSLAANILDEVNGSKPGQVDKVSILPQLLKLGFYIALAVAVALGKLTVDQADTAKSVVE
jgi:hypothetical protein